MADVQPPVSSSEGVSSAATSTTSIACASSTAPASATSSIALAAEPATDIEAIQVPRYATTGDVNDPATYKRSQDPDWKNTSLEDIYSSWDKLVPVDELPKYEEMGLFLVEHDPQTARELEKAFVLLRRKFKCLPKKSQMKFVLGLLVQKGEAPKGVALEKLLVKKAQKSQSGVLVVTVLTSPYPAVGGKKQKFSCQWNCYYCPNEPDQPRSYLHDEPSVLRANRNDFDPVLQFCDRCVTLAMNGHPVDKIELLVLGGTWASYPVEYQENFIRDLFYAANTFFNRDSKRERRSLDEEKLENETAAVKIIGITLETRPDCITPEELRRFRRYGCTRVQLGIQHTDDGILKKINRGHTLADAVAALKLLRDCCYKTDIHLMPNLPGSDPEKDRAMFDYVLHTPNLHADQWKIYPCEITPWTVIKKWYDEGSYVPYAEDKLIELLMDVKAEVHPWIRLNRVIRDIPSQYILGGMDEPNLRQVIGNKMIARGTPCKCIRCREVKTDDAAIATAECVIREYEANEGQEYFISFETPDRSKICGFARLRLSQSAGGGVFPELEGAALIRELHVYGQLVAAISKSKKDAASTGVSDAEGSHAQHTGFGTQLMLKAEEIARAHGYKKVAVIAGVGVRNFYRRLGFEVEGEGELMIKHLKEMPAPGIWSKVNSFVSENLCQALPPKMFSAVAIGGVVVISAVTAAMIRRRR